MTDQELAPLFSDGDLDKLATGILRLTKERRFAVLERFVAIRGAYERERLVLRARIAELESEQIDTTYQLPPVIDPRNYGETSMGHYIQSLDE